MAYASKAYTASLLALLAAIPTALGYILGPITHAVNLPLRFLGVPFGVRLGTASLVMVCVLARAYLGRGKALIEGVLLALTGALFHQSQPATIRVPKDILLGLGVEIGSLRARDMTTGYSILSSFLGGLLSYAPYLIFTPVNLSTAVPFYASILMLMSGYLISSLIGGYLASLVLRLLPSTKIL